MGPPLSRAAQRTVGLGRLHYDPTMNRQEQAASVGPTEDSVPVVILCGGKGSRIREASPLVPKPMLTIGDRPMLWHIMKLYGGHGFTEFVLALGYLGDVIRTFILHYEALTRDFTVDFGSPDGVRYLQDQSELGWRVSCVETGADALTGTRVRRATSHLTADTIMVTYGDGVGDVDLTALLAFHRSHPGLATITTVRPPGRFGELHIDDDDRIVSFEEKPQTSTGTINGGFMVFDRGVIDRYIPEDADVMLERDPLNQLAKDGELYAFRHDGFWQPMDTPRERELLQELWDAGNAPWKIWT